MNDFYRDIDNRLINLQAKISRKKLTYQKWRIENWELVKKTIPPKDETLGFEAEIYTI